MIILESHLISPQRALQSAPCMPMPQFIQCCAILPSFDIKYTFFMARSSPEAQLDTPDGGGSYLVVLLDANFSINGCIIHRVSSAIAIGGAAGKFVFSGLLEAVAGDGDSGTVPKS